MATVLQTARGLKSMVSLVRDPNKLDEVFSIAENMLRPTFLERMVEAAKKTDEGALAFRDRPRVGTLDVDQLLLRPEGSLGREFALHMKKNGLDPSAIPTRDVSDDPTYLRAHLYETHDIWHVVTGFQTDVAGELGLQAVYLAQLPSRLAGTLITGGLVNMMFFNFNDRDARLSEISRGWVLGKNARPLFGARWAEMFDEPLVEVRRRYGIVDPTRSVS